MVSLTEEINLYFSITTIDFFEYIFCLETCFCSVPPAMLSKRHVTSYKISLSKENNVDNVTVRN